MIPKLKKKKLSITLLSLSRQIHWGITQCTLINIHALLFVNTFFGFNPKFRKRNWNFKKAFHYFVELVDTNSLMYNIKDKNEVQLFVWRSWYRRTDRIDFGMYSQRPFEWYIKRLPKMKNSWRWGQQYTSPVTLGGRHKNHMNRKLGQNSKIGSHQFVRNLFTIPKLSSFLFMRY